MLLTCVPVSIVADSCSSPIGVLNAGSGDIDMACADTLKSIVPYLGIICGLVLIITGVVGLLDVVDIPAFIKALRNFYPTPS